MKSATDPNHPPLSATNPHTVEYEYDDVGNRTQMKTVAQTVNYQFDERNRMKEVRSRRLGETTDQVTTYGYTPAGSRDTQTHSNGTTVKYDYNPRHQLTNVAHKTAAAVLLLGLSYTLDASGLRTDIIESGQSTRINHYEYDQRKRLTLETVKPNQTGAVIRSNSFEYDPVGNRLKEVKTVGGVTETTTSTYDRNDRLTTAVTTTAPAVITSSINYSYDANGRQIGQVTTPATGAATTVTYGWDSRDRMISSINTSGTTSVKTVFAYDPDGTRISSTENVGTAQAKTIRYLVDRNQAYSQVIEERVVGGEDSNADLGKLATVYTFGDDLLANTTCAVSSTESNCAAGDTRVLHYDGLGSTRFLSDSGGVTTDRYAYEAFGEVDSVGSSGTFSNAFQFTGERFEPKENLYYLRARYLNVGTGRFLSADKFAGLMRQPASLVKYLYVENEPISSLDPTGQMTLAETSNSQAVVGEGSSQSVSLTTKQILKQRDWIVFRVQLTSAFLSHEFIWVKNKKTKQGLGYHVLTDRRSVLLSARTGNFVPAIFGIFPQAEPNKMLGRPLAIKSIVPVGYLGNVGFALWTATTVGVMSEGDTCPFSYQIPTSNCITWTDAASANAVFWSLSLL